MSRAGKRASFQQAVDQNAEPKQILDAEVRAATRGGDEWVNRRQIRTFDGDVGSPASGIVEVHSFPATSTRTQGLDQGKVATAVRVKGVRYPKTCLRSGRIRCSW